MKKTGDQGPGRRRFLKQAVTVIPGVIAISGVAPAASNNADDSCPKEARQQLSQGYRETEHIKKYYKKAGF